VLSDGPKPVETQREKEKSQPGQGRPGPGRGLDAPARGYLDTIGTEEENES